MNILLQRRIVEPLLALLRQGITPEKIALSLACGIVLGMFPVLGSTTLLCAVAALMFRLNLPAVQLVNYFMYPVQLAMVVPFIKAGEWILREDRTKLTLPEMMAIVKQDHTQALHLLWRLAWHGVVAWTLFAPLAFYLSYRLLLPVVTHLSERLARKRETPVGIA